MECRFEGAFTEDEKDRIRARLKTLSQAAGALGLSSDPHWRVERVVNDTEFYLVIHVESHVELWGRTVDHLVDQIEQTTELLRSAS